jgi:hypothetical protein
MKQRRSLWFQAGRPAKPGALTGKRYHLRAAACLLMTVARRLDCEPQACDGGAARGY